MPKVTCLYIDDSGTRNPNHKPSTEQFADWFALGGIMIAEEREAEARQAHAEFCQRWGIIHPLHSYDIRQREGDFTWLRGLTQDDYGRFMQDLSDLLLQIPVIGHACVIDRRGYDARYREQYGRQTWHLCKTAFSVLCERAAKVIKAQDRRLRVYPEAGDISADTAIRRYYAALKREGMPFAGPDASKYDALGAEDLSTTLYDLKFKNKSSPLAQIADLYLYPMARAGYERDYYPFRLLSENRKVIDTHLSRDDVEHIGIKYSCFELVREA